MATQPFGADSAPYLIEFHNGQMHGHLRLEMNLPSKRTADQTKSWL